MKLSFLSALLFLFLLSCGGNTTTFAVSGNCGMCKKNIESAALSVEGVKKAEWDREKKTITLTHAENVKPEQVGTAIANKGYDNEYKKGDDVAYEELNTCCQYRSTTH